MKKLISILLTLVLVLSFSLTMAVPVAAQETYNIGDVGPAGGWIFYDLGGGRYLEAAPEDLPGTGGPIWGSIKVPQDVWSEVGDTVVGTSDAIGTGQANTNAIVGQPSTTGMAVLADALVVNGYDDWYLPSLDELTAMRDNLATSQANVLKYGFWGGVPGTSPRHYWSSSEFCTMWGYRAMKCM